jgi:hypothetical protein
MELIGPRRVHYSCSEHVDHGRQYFIDEEKVGADSVAKDMIANMRADSREWQTEQARHCGYGELSHQRCSIFNSADSQKHVIVARRLTRNVPLMDQRHMGLTSVLLFDKLRLGRHNLNLQRAVCPPEPAQA